MCLGSSSWSVAVLLLPSSCWSRPAVDATGGSVLPFAAAARNRCFGAEAQRGAPAIARHPLPCLTALHRRACSMLFRQPERRGDDGVGCGNTSSAAVRCGATYIGGYADKLYPVPTLRCLQDLTTAPLCALWQVVCVPVH